MGVTLALIGASLAVSACRAVEASTADAAGAQAVVVTVEAAPAWQNASTTVEVTGPSGEVLFEGPLTGESPMLVDVTLPTETQRVTVRLREPKRQRQRTAEVIDGYAQCRFD